MSVNEGPPSLLVPGWSVPVHGVAAWWVVQMVQRAPRFDPTGLTADQRAQIADMRAALEAVSEEWVPREAARRKRLPGVNGSTEAVRTEVAAGLPEDDITPEVAADMLEVTAHRVRQRARRGELGARKAGGGRWIVSHAAVLDERDRRASA